MKVKFSRCTSSNLANVPRVDGQIIYVKDTHEMYMDVGTNRNKMSDVVEVANINNVSSPIGSKIYYDEATQKLYKYVSNTWVNLSDIAQKSQVYFWNGTTTSADIELWNSVLETCADFPVAIFTLYKSNYYICIITQPAQLIGYGAYFMCINTPLYADGPTYTTIENNKTITVGFTISQGGVITAITGITESTGNQIRVLRTDYDYQTPYTPQYAGSPATKQYVDTKCVPYQPFPSGITTNSTTQVFMNSIKALTLPAGSTYLGGVTLSDMPFVGNAEVEVYVYPNNVIYCELRSSNVSPYRWECNSHTYRGWEAINHPTASSVSYSNSTSGLSASTTQGAIDELAGSVGNINSILDDINGEVV